MSTRRRHTFDGIFNRRANTLTDCYGQTIARLHSEKECAGRHCPVHNLSDHPMRKFKFRWRIPGWYDIKPLHAERVCEHGVGHPDPDDMEHWRSIGEDSMGIHGCDGCCE